MFFCQFFFCTPPVYLNLLSCLFFCPFVASISFFSYSPYFRPFLHRLLISLLIICRLCFSLPVLYHLPPRLVCLLQWLLFHALLDCFLPSLVFFSFFYSPPPLCELSVTWCLDVYSFQRSLCGFIFLPLPLVWSPPSFHISGSFCNVPTGCRSRPCTLCFKVYSAPFFFIPFLTVSFLSVLVLLYGFSAHRLSCHCIVFRCLFTIAAFSSLLHHHVRLYSAVRWGGVVLLLDSWEKRRSGVQLGWKGTWRDVERPWVFPLKERRVVIQNPWGISQSEIP